MERHLSKWIHSTLQFRFKFGWLSWTLWDCLGPFEDPEIFETLLLLEHLAVLIIDIRLASDPPFIDLNVFSACTTTSWWCIKQWTSPTHPLSAFPTCNHLTWGVAVIMDEQRIWETKWCRLMESRMTDGGPYWPGTLSTNGRGVGWG